MCGLVLGVGVMALLTPNDIETSLFTVRGLIRKGYDADEVDDLLDECADTVRRLCVRALQADSRANAFQAGHRLRRRALKRSRKSIKGKGLEK